MKKVTAWYVKKKTHFEFNHISDGWSKDKKPVGHKSWASCEWKKQYCYHDLVTGKVEKVGS